MEKELFRLVVLPCFDLCPTLLTCIIANLHEFYFNTFLESVFNQNLIKKGMMSPYKRLNIECSVCHVTGNIHYLVHYSPQMPKMIALDG